MLQNGTEWCFPENSDQLAECTNITQAVAMPLSTLMQGAKVRTYLNSLHAIVCPKARLPTEPRKCSLHAANFSCSLERMASLL